MEGSGLNLELGRGAPRHLSTYPGSVAPSSSPSSSSLEYQPMGESPLDEEKRYRYMMEKKHLEEVVAAFREYPRYMSFEVDRRWQHICKLTPEQVVRLPSFSLGHKLNALKHAIATNHLLLETIVQYVDEVAQCKGVLDVVGTDQRILITTTANVAKIKATLHCCVREWSDEGAVERSQCFGPIIEELERRLPVPSPSTQGEQDKPTPTPAGGSSKIRVLVPGAGLGRLPLEIASRGYACQGNEFSYYMLLTSNFLLNHVDEARSLAVCPFVDQTCNIVKTVDSLRRVMIPDVSPVELLGLKSDDGTSSQEDPQESSGPPDFSMAAGEFLEVYSDQAGCWDCVVTCFFLDTAPVVIEYVDAIHRLLRPGGVWINFGPLLYHWATTRTSPSDGNDGLDERYHRSVELTWEELRHVILSYGFRLEREELRESLYTCNNLSMLRTVYDCMFFTAVKADAPQ